MKTLIVTALLFTSLLSLRAQSFEGRILYRNSYQSLGDISEKQLAAMLGTTTEYLIRRGDYKTISNGKKLQWQLYTCSENRLYCKTASSDTIFWFDGADADDEVIHAAVNRKVAKILGQDCDELVLTCRSGTRRYYYSSTYPIDARLFEKHRYDNWAEYTEKSRAVPLKIVIETADYRVESTAVEVKPMAIDDRTFTLFPGVLAQGRPF